MALAGSAWAQQAKAPVVVVVDAQGAPVGGATVHVVHGHWRHEKAGKTDSNGRLELGSSKEVRSVTAFSSRYCFADLVDVPAGAAKEEFRLVLGQPAAAIEGQVVDSRGKPVPDAWVTLRMLTKGKAVSYGSYGRPSWWLSCDKRGRFQAAGLPVGRLPVAVWPHGAALAPQLVHVDLKEATTGKLKVTLAESPRLVGVVRNEAGRPVPATIHMSSEAHYDMFFADDSGKFTNKNVPHERVRLLV